MTDAILGGIILAMIAERAYVAYEHRKQEKDYIKAILAKDLRDLSQADIAEKIEPQKEEIQSEFVPIESADDSLWNAAMNKVLGKDN